MRFHSTAALAMIAMLSACGDARTPTGAFTPDVDASMNASSAITAKVTGSGHVFRDVGNGEELSTFSYSAIGRADGSASGEYQYNFRALDFSIHGTVTCVSVLGNQGWVGGVIDGITSADPADQALVGTEVWWRVVDNGQGSNDAADRTTSLLFALPTSPTTSASWCNDRAPRGLLRDIVHGNIQVQ
jgi:hypothetical protein